MSEIRPLSDQLNDIQDCPECEMPIPREWFSIDAWKPTANITRLWCPFCRMGWETAWEFRSGKWKDCGSIEYSRNSGRNDLEVFLDAIRTSNIVPA